MSGVPELDELTPRHDELAADRPLVTTEIHPPNDYYGHATILKKYAGLPPTESLPLGIQHGVRFDLDYWRHDYRKDHAVGFVHSPWRVEVMREKVQRKLYAIGPYLHYAQSLLPPERVATIRAKLGKTLLVFPAHSTQHIAVDFDIAAFCERLADERKNFSTVLVCLYWKDILRGAREHYERHGLRCVTAGHMLDTAFIPRLRALLELADATLSNQVGTHLGYSLYLGKPHQLIPAEINRNFTSEEHRSGSTANTRLDGELFRERFAPAPEIITPDQLELAEKYWGFSAVRTPAELRTLVAEAAREQKALLRRRSFQRITAKLRSFLPGRSQTS